METWLFSSKQSVICQMGEGGETVKCVIRAFLLRAKCVGCWEIIIDYFALHFLLWNLMGCTNVPCEVSHQTQAYLAMQGLTFIAMNEAHSDV